MFLFGAIKAALSFCSLQNMSRLQLGTLPAASDSNTERPFIPFPNPPYSSQTLHKAKCHHPVRTLINALGRHNSTTSGNSRKPVSVFMTYSGPCFQIIAIKWLVGADFRLKITAMLHWVSIALSVHLTGGIFGGNLVKFPVCQHVPAKQKVACVLLHTKAGTDSLWPLCKQLGSWNTVLTFPQRGLCCNLRKRESSFHDNMTSSQTKQSLSAAHIYLVPCLKEIKIKENDARS